MHCASCGAPSVLGASRCPRCLAPFGAVGPMSGMVLAEEEAPTPRPKIRWIGLGALALALLLGIGAWAARRIRGTPPVATIPVTGDTAVREPAPVDSVPRDSVARDSVTAVAMVPSPADTVRRKPRVETPLTKPAAKAVPSPAPTRAATPAAPAATKPAPAPPPAAAPSSGEAYRSTTWVWLRANPVNTAEQLGVVNPKQGVTILERRFGWARVRVDGKEGWMSADFLERVPE